MRLGLVQGRDISLFSSGELSSSTWSCSYKPGQWSCNFCCFTITTSSGWCHSASRQHPMAVLSLVKAMNPWGIHCPLQLASWCPPEARGRGGCPGGIWGISSHGNLPTPSTWAGICPAKGWALWAGKNKTKSGTLTLIETNNVVPKQSRSKPYKNKGWSQDQCLWHSAAFSTEIT